LTFTVDCAALAATGSPTRGLIGAGVLLVSLGLLISELIKINRITVDPARVRNTVELVAASYEEPDQVVKEYYGNRELLSGIEAVVLEDQVDDWLLERAQVHDVATTFDALMNPVR